MRARELICIVVPEPDEGAELASLLADLNADIQWFRSAEDFLERSNGRSAACLISDTRLPAMSGVELLEYLRDMNQEVPTILIARQGNVREAVRAIRFGAEDYFEVPFVDRLLYRRVAAILDRHCTAT